MATDKVSNYLSTAIYPATCFTSIFKPYRMSQKTAKRHIIIQRHDPTIPAPTKRGKGKHRGDLKENKTPEERRAAMTWAQRLKRVFNIDVETCAHCGGAVKVIACIEDQQVIDKILSHLKKKDGLPLPPDALPEVRAPPQTNLFG
jgi:hypothetical protein